jgi:DNA-nicking Smr family endonuclease
VSAGSDRSGSRRRRPLTPDERALWRTVTRSVAPLRSAQPVEPETDDRPASEAPPPSPPPILAWAKMSQRVEPASQPPLAPLGRRLRQRVARGNAALDARIDLHGLTQEDAYHALRAFLRGAQADGARLVLVITGKGARGDSAHGGERGVLKRLVPQWLRLPQFRATVVGFEPAHVSHGGEGALYVRIRRARN